METKQPSRQQIIDAIRDRDEQAPQWPVGTPEAQLQEAFNRACPPEVLADHVLSLPGPLQRELLKKCLPELLP